MSAVGGLVLAAGGSSRMGAPKQLLECDGVSLLHRSVTVALAAGLDPVVVAVGPHAERCAAQLAGLPALLAWNESWTRGMGSSLKCGLARLLAAAPRIDAAVISLCDQPEVPSELLAELARLALHEHVGAAACRHADGPGAPAAFARRRFPELAALPDGQGAKSLLRKLPASALLTSAAATIDLDTPSEVQEWHRRSTGNC